MSEQEKRLAAERAEIAARVASFRATQQRFEREREEYFITTLQNARGIKRNPLLVVIGARQWKKARSLHRAFRMTGNVRHQWR